MSVQNPSMKKDGGEVMAAAFPAETVLLSAKIWKDKKKRQKRRQSPRHNLIAVQP